MDAESAAAHSQHIPIMLDLLNRNFATVSMLVALGMVLTALVTLLMTGKITADAAIATALGTSVGSIVGGIAGYSMHRSSDTTAQANGIQITKTETGGS